MREIEFRAWSRRDNKMFHDVGIESGNAIIDTKAHGLYPLKGESVLMQYTGLKDKNSKEIYEGDILAPMANDDRPEYKGNWTVIYREGAFFGEGIDGVIETWLPYWLPDAEIEVIGNIYENPELLEVEK